MPAPLLQVNNLEVEYNHLVRVLKGLSLAVPEGEIVFCGDGVGPFGAMFRDRLGVRARLASGPEGLPRAGAVGSLGEAAFREGAAEDPRTAIPRYLRPSEAEASRAGGGPG